MLNPITAIVLALTVSHTAAAAGAPSNAVADMIEKRTPLRTHSIAQPYVDTDLQNRWWDFGGDAIVNTNKHIRLTQDRQSQSGWLWSRMPLTLPNWQIDVEFKVDGHASSLYGDGFAMWITEERAVVGPVFGSQDKFTGLGIFFDTYANSRHTYSFPRVTAMLGDGETAYDLAGDNEDHEIGACSVGFRRRDVATKARLTYVKGKGFQLQLHTKEWDKWETCFQIDVKLPPLPYVGFSAVTGDVTDNHDIVTVNTNSGTLYQQYRDEPEQAVFAAGKNGKKVQAPQRPPKPAGSSGGAVSWFLWLLKMIGVLAFIAFAFAAYRTYAAQQQKRPTYY